jgi:AcrR family transcriptional regulator
LPDGVRALRRRQIIAASRALVAEGGLEALTIARLERQLGYSRGVITYHFRDKDEIVDELLASAVDEIDHATRAEVAAASSARDRVAAVIRAVVRGFLSRVEAMRILLSFWGRLHADPRIRAVNARLYARYRKQTAELLGRRRGADAMATVIVGVVLGIAAQAYFDPAHVDVDAAIDEAIGAVQARLRRGMLARSGA